MAEIGRNLQHRIARAKHHRGRADVLDLRSVTTTGDADTDVEVGELVEANDEEGLVDLNYENRQHLCSSRMQTTSSLAQFHPPLSCCLNADIPTGTFQHGWVGARSSSWVSRGGKSYLGAEDSGLDELQRAAVDLDETLAGLGLGDSLCSIHRQQT